MDKSKNYEKSVPENYVLVKYVDAKNKKQITIYTILSFVPLLIIFSVLVLIARYCNGYNISNISKDSFGLFTPLITCVVLFSYIVLHEITHGITYKIFTGAKLTYGFSLTVAFCGVPEIYVRKKASIVALVMPFLVFSVIFTASTIILWFVSPAYGIISGMVLAVHLGGCVGDLHWTMLYLTKFKHCNTIMRDTGPAQWLYIPQEEAEKFGISCISDNKE